MLSALFNAISRRVAHILISLYVRYTELMQNEVKSYSFRRGTLLDDGLQCQFLKLLHVVPKT